MKKISLFLFGAFFALCSFAQSKDTTLEVRKHEFGVHLGFTTGMGLSYRYWPTKYGVQFTALPVKTNHEVYVNMAITGLRTFYESKYIHFFGYISNNVILERKYNDDYQISTYTNEQGNQTTVYSGSSNGWSKTTAKYNLGFGPGFGFGDRVRFNVMVGYAIYDVFDAFNIRPTGELGLYFRM